MSKISGGCACGAVRYRSEAEPVLMLNCHCRDCQRASGSAYAAIMVLPKAALTIEGEPRYHSVHGNVGSVVERGFCASCGNPLFINLERRPEIIGLQAGSLDDPAVFKPAMDIFTASAHPWDSMNPDLPKRPQGL